MGGAGVGLGNGTGAWIGGGTGVGVGAATGGGAAANRGEGEDIGEGPVSWLTELCAEVHPNSVTTAPTLTHMSQHAFVHPCIAAHNECTLIASALELDQLRAKPKAFSISKKS